MNSNPPHSGTRPPRREEATHLFAVGQAVRLKRGFNRAYSPSDTYQVTATLPPQGGYLQYRIRNDKERHERVVTQNSLEPVAAFSPGSDATLMERTFDHGQGTKTQQSRDQKTQTAKNTTKD